MSKFSRIEYEVKKIIKRLQDFSGLERELVEKLYAYARSLEKGNGDGIIDDLVFFAEMIKTFGITQKTMLDRMYYTAKDAVNIFMTSEDFARLLCIFMCLDSDKQRSFVFNVYDVDGDGSITMTELQCYFRQYNLILNEDEADHDDNLKDMIDFVLKIIDKNCNGQIEKEEFLLASREQPLLLEVLGKCMPSNETVLRFKDYIDNMTLTELKMKLVTHRLELLRDPQEKKHNYYPIYIDLP